MMTLTPSKLIFKHLVELPHCECVFCSTQDEQTGRTRIYLIFKENHRVYQRNGIKGNWEEVSDADCRQAVMDGFQQAVIERKIPSFIASSPAFAGM
jgi:hypothetical protein